MIRSAVLSIGLVLVALCALRGDAHAQKTCPFSVSASGASIEVPTNPAYVTTVTLWEPISVTTKARGSLDPKDYLVNPLGDRALVIQPLRTNAGPGNIVVPTKTGIQVAIAVRVDADPKVACSIVSVERVTEGEAFKRRVDEEVAKRTAAVEAELAELRAELAERVSATIDQELATRAVARRELVRARYVDRNADELIVRVGEVLYLGDGAAVAFEIQNRRKGKITIAAVELTADHQDQAAAVAMQGGTIAGGIGAVAANDVARGVVVVRSVARLRGRTLALVVKPAPGQGGAVTVGGVVLK